MVLKFGFVAFVSPLRKSSKISSFLRSLFKSSYKHYKYFYAFKENPHINFQKSHGQWVTKYIVQNIKKIDIQVNARYKVMDSSMRCISLVHGASLHSSWLRFSLQHQYIMSWGVSSHIFHILFYICWTTLQNNLHPKTRKPHSPNPLPPMHTITSIRLSLCPLLCEIGWLGTRKKTSKSKHGVDDETIDYKWFNDKGGWIRGGGSIQNITCMYYNN